MAEGSTGFNDPIHGYMEFEPLLVRIIHTPQFQRMKDIKQLGAGYWVYPGASHNRFEHSLGTAYLAGMMIERLRDIHKNEKYITDEDVLCVKIAALCHDLGHGPFSHVFDKQMRRKLMKYQEEQGDIEKSDRLDKWKHESASCDMLDEVLNQLENVEGIGDDERNLIKDIIKGKGIEEQIEQKATHTVDGQELECEKWFLFEIVANKINGIDCDKFDYFARDCLNLGVKSNFDHLRYIQNIRILPDGNKLRLCVRDKLVFNIYELFHTRWSLHHRVYQHKTVKAIEEMITDAFILLESEYKFSQAILEDIKEYAKLTDSIFYKIIYDSSPIDAQNQAVEAQNQAVEALNQAVEAQNQAVEAQHQAVEAQTRAVEAQNQAVEAPNQAVEAQNQAVVAQTRAVEAQNQAVESQNKAIEARTKAVEAQNQALEAQNQAVEAPNQAVEAQNQAIQNTPKKKAQEILKRIQQRKLYKFCSQAQLSENSELNHLDVAKEIAELDQNVTADELLVSIVEINFGMKDKDPVESVLFYDKTGNIARQTLENDKSSMLPQKFSEKYVRVYGKNLALLTPDKKAEKKSKIKTCFKEWKNSNPDNFT